MPSFEIVIYRYVVDEDDQQDRFISTTNNVVDPCYDLVGLAQINLGMGFQLGQKIVALLSFSLWAKTPSSFSLPLHSPFHLRHRSPSTTPPRTTPSLRTPHCPSPSCSHLTHPLLQAITCTLADY
ncbi:hypothetical protein VNO78_15820 [Psophocarpus tetragonolobus]|uniref:Uncharacterized protein n=1 Tax=Psophocarpus tetragonolobus TaxID=3891 RepID=A0AAN9SGQ9_PSOTE